MARPNIGPNGAQLEMGNTTVAVSGGSGTLAVIFGQSFTRIPQVLVVDHEADAGSYSATTITETGFTVAVTSSDYADGDIKVGWLAVEKS